MRYRRAAAMAAVAVAGLGAPAHADKCIWLEDTRSHEIFCVCVPTNPCLTATLCIHADDLVSPIGDMEVPLGPVTLHVANYDPADPTVGEPCTPTVPEP